MFPENWTRNILILTHDTATKRPDGTYHKIIYLAHLLFNLISHPALGAVHKLH